jgi:tetratricopeptide (TPR) repeat protein
MEILNKNLKQRVSSLFDKSNKKFDLGYYGESIKYLEEAWDALPDPKGIYDESYHFAMYLSETYLLVKNYERAKKWADEIYHCHLERIDSGEREFLSGKVAYAMGDLSTANRYFLVANEKSEGRCFENEDKKYLKFFKILL